MHYHGTPITPYPKLNELRGRFFCTSFAAPGQVKFVHQIGQGNMLDNGAFTFWNSEKTPNWDGYFDWAEQWLDYQTTWAVIPDVIDGSEEENDALILRWNDRGLPRGAPVWHMHESLDRLRRLVSEFERVCFGSSGIYKTPGTEVWRRRADKAFDAIAEPSGRIYCWIHMLRGMSLSGDVYPFSSVDSTDIARNHHLAGKSAVAMANRWDAMQCPARWKESA